MKVKVNEEITVLHMSLDVDIGRGFYITFKYESGGYGLPDVLIGKANGHEFKVSADNALRIARFMERFADENRGSSEPEFDEVE